MTRDKDCSIASACSVLAIAAAVIVSHGRVLLVRRRMTEGNLSWQFPAGKIEPGEDPAAAAVRETREETGLVVAAASGLGERFHPATGRKMIYTACSVLNGHAGVVATDEIDAIAWASRADLTGHLPLPLHPPVQDYLNSRLL